MPRRIASFRIDSHELVGERLRVDGHLSRTGVQIYSDGYGGQRREYRDPTEVFDQKSLESLRVIPVTIQHPSSLVNGSNFKDLAVGVVGENVRKADDGIHVEASLWILDSAAIRRVQSKELTELSVGYMAGLDETPGITPAGEHYDARQVEIRGNHIALLKAGQARGGSSVRLILDSNGDAIFDGDPSEEKNMKFQIRADGLLFDVEAADSNVVKALEKERTDSEQILKDSEDQAVKEKARADAAEEKAAKLEKELKELKKAEIARSRKKLISDAQRLDKDLVVKDGDTDADIQRRVLANPKLNAESDEYVGFRFKLALEELDEKPPKRDRARELLHGDHHAEDLGGAFSLDDTFREMRS